jgi:hypothetical protein
VTLAPKGLLIEEQRTNLVLQSQFGGSGVWNTANAVQTVNAAVAPDGTITASSIVPNTTAGVQHSVVQTTTATLGVQYAYSVYAKANGYTNIQFFGDSSGNFTATFNLTAVTAAFGGSATAASITPVGNGWYRCVAIFTMATSARLNVQGFPTGATASNFGNTFTGDGTSGVFIWGAQLEQGAFSTSYIPTVASQVTRAADSASMIGNNFARWFNVSAGTMFADFSGFRTGSTFGNIFGAGAVGFQSLFGQNTSVFAGANPFASGSANPVNPTKAAGAYSASGVSLAINSALAFGGAQPVAQPTSFAIFGNWNGQFGNGTMKRVAFYSRALSASELQGITS